MKLAMGQYDAPQKQRQPVFEISPYAQNIAVFGSSMSGKTTFIKTLLVRLHQNRDQVPAQHIYIVDFGGNIGEYGKLRNVCACCDNSNEENIKRIFRTVESRLEENARILESKDYQTVVSKTPEKAPPHLFLIIENLNAFYSDERYASYQDRLIRFCRDGRSRGLTVVITANETNGINRLVSYFGQKVAFEMAQEAYFDIFGSKVSKPMNYPGRGVINIDSETYEFQCFLPFPSREDEAHIHRLVEQTATWPNPYAMRFLPEVLTWEEMDRCAHGKWSSLEDNEVVVGLDYYEHNPVTVNFDHSRSIAIYGKRNSGKKNLLTLLLKGIRRHQPQARYVFVDDGRNVLRSFCPEEGPAFADDCVYLTSANDFWDYLTGNGYGAKRRGNAPRTLPERPELLDTPFTVFVLQSKQLYRPTDTDYVMGRLIPAMIADARARGYLFIFSDIPSISETSIRDSINHNTAVAFLTESIGEFVADKGSKSVFGEMDAKELKMEYAKCSLGDGYCYDVDSDQLQKLKFILDE